MSPKKKKEKEKRKTNEVITNLTVVIILQYIYVYQITQYTLNLCNMTCMLINLNKAGKKKRQEEKDQLGHMKHIQTKRRDTKKLHVTK